MIIRVARSGPETKHEFSRVFLVHICTLAEGHTTPLIDEPITKLRHVNTGEGSLHPSVETFRAAGVFLPKDESHVSTHFLLCANISTNTRSNTSPHAHVRGHVDTHYETRTVSSRYARAHARMHTCTHKCRHERVHACTNAHIRMHPRTQTHRAMGQVPGTLLRLRTMASLLEGKNVLMESFLYRLYVSLTDACIYKNE